MSDQQANAPAYNWRENVERIAADAGREVERVHDYFRGNPEHAQLPTTHEEAVSLVQANVAEPPPDLTPGGATAGQ